MTKAKHLTKVTDINKLFLEQAINEGDIVVDATMGNGYDTKYLAHLVGENGFVYAFDVQEEALKSTKKKLEKDEITDRVELILDGHENMDKYIDKKVACVVFNLGYLPRAQHMIITKPNTTIKAIEHSLNLLKPHGIVSIAIYTGHPGGEEEKNSIYDFVENLDQNEFSVLESKFVNQINNPPQLILIEKKMEY
ncbi:methyltransferase domain-containing protein [Romboutsia maritimum]|uniref:Methyltransferase domain-containing protein n=1 Tax=Romboutsia maritimum TaxID=2020948 RepID=A0A371IV01_9FIRM|nr:class I SAM-dependent methyltransferase [Romboutsia maritimum]RDY24289.1 methyltransferase domain-containing protein [Romboutsia maritimum]